MVPFANIGIISIGEMGLGIAELLAAHNYQVLTNVTGRSQSTAKRAASASITLVPSDAYLVSQSDYILSIVPPRDARATAKRIISASSIRQESPSPLYYLDLNAIAPSTTRSIAAAFEPLGAECVRYVDGGIIGGPPKPDPRQHAENGTNTTTPQHNNGSSWSRPSVVLSGPHPLHRAPKSGAHLAAVLNGKHVADEVGTASGLKCCFASLTKGFIALAIQSFTTAEKLCVLDKLQEEIVRVNGSQQLERVKMGIVSMAPKAGRWVEEMREIGKTFGEEGGWEEENIFNMVAGVYSVVSGNTVLGNEKVEERSRGKSMQDAVEAIREGLDKKMVTRQPVEGEGFCKG